MDANEKILRALGKIEGELVEIRKLSERVRRLELALVVLMAVAWLCK